ncbi:MAG: hypothetical protein J6A62_01890 [Oscillospiraceae bacterium]|nr:hypothetical protein [Oscillospiraceae bacterium]
MDMKNCSAGFARLDITGPLGVHIAGYYNERIADGVLDPLYVNAVAFGQDDKIAVLLVCDMLGIYSTAAFEFPRHVARTLGLPEDSVFLCHTHSHTTPAVAHYREPCDPQYDEWFLRRLCDAAKLAIDDLKPVTDVQIAEDDIPGLTFVRRFYYKDGHFQTWAPADRSLIDRPGCDGDDSARLIRILREDDEIALVNYQLHPDCIGGCKYSADFPGAFRNRIEAERPNVHCVFLNGAEGQMIGTNFNIPAPPKAKGSDRAVRVGNQLAEGVLPMFERCKSTNMTGLSFGQDIVRAKTKRDPARMPEAERLIALHEAGKDAEIGPHWHATPLVAEAYVLRRLEAENTDYSDLAVSAISFCGMALLGIPGEPFNEVGKHIRANSPFPATCVCCQANGCEGYYPIAEAYDQGGYEPRNTRYPKGTAELLMEAADKLLAGL